MAIIPSITAAPNTRPSSAATSRARGSYWRARSSAPGWPTAGPTRHGWSRRDHRGGGWHRRAGRQFRLGPAALAAAARHGRLHGGQLPAVDAPGTQTAAVLHAVPVGRRQPGRRYPHREGPANHRCRRQKQREIAGRILGQGRNSAHRRYRLRIPGRVRGQVAGHGPREIVQGCQEDNARTEGRRGNGVSALFVPFALCSPSGWPWSGHSSSDTRMPPD